MRRIWHISAALLVAAAVSTACGDEDAEPGTVNPDNPETTVQTGGAELTIQVPGGAQSFAIVVDGIGNNLVLADKVTSPSGKVVFDFQNDINDNLLKADDQVYTAIIPNSPAVQMEEGDWKVTFFTDASAEFELNVKVIFKTTPASAKALDLNMLFVGVDGLDAATAENDAAFQQVLSNVGEVYAKAGISFGNVNYFDVPADGFSPLQDNDLNALLAKSGDFGLSGQSLNFFFVSDIEGGDEGFSLLGLSGGVPGPPGVHGTRKSGVVVNMSDFADSPELVEMIMAHEGGHYLGLYHTTERNGAALDPDGITGSDHLGDTPVCPDDADANGNGSLSASECAAADGNNIMFFSPGDDSTRDLTDDQGDVLLANPIVR